MNKSLPAILKEQTALDELLLESGGDITDEQTDAIVMEWMVEIVNDVKNKVDGYEHKQTYLKQSADRLHQYADKFYNAAKSMDKISDSLKTRLKNLMIDHGKNELVGNMFVFKLSQSKPSVLITDESSIPVELIDTVVTTKPNKERIKTMIEAGIEVKGASLYYGNTLRVGINKESK